jgi:hypothetical protein
MKAARATVAAISQGFDRGFQGACRMAGAGAAVVCDADKKRLLGAR